MKISNHVVYKNVIIFNHLLCPNYVPKTKLELISKKSYQTLRMKDEDCTYYCPNSNMVEPKQHPSGYQELWTMFGHLST